MKKTPVQTKKILSNFSSSAITTLLEKSPHAALSEKFLLSMHERNNWLLRALSKFETRRQHLLDALSLFPVFFAVSFFCPTELGDLLRKNETLTRLWVGYFFGGGSFIGGYPATTSKKQLLFLTVVCFALIPAYLFFYAPETLFWGFIGTPAKRTIFLVGSLYMLLLPIFLLLFWLWKKIRALIFGTDQMVPKVQKELEELLQKALVTSHQAKIEELRALIADTAPEYGIMLKNLKQSNPDMLLNIPPPLDPLLLLPKRLPCPSI